MSSFYILYSDDGSIYSALLDDEQEKKVGQKFIENLDVRGKYIYWLTERIMKFKMRNINILFYMFHLFLGCFVYWAGKEERGLGWTEFWNRVRGGEKILCLSV